VITTLKAGSSHPFQHLLNKYRRSCKVLPNFQRTAQKGNDESNPRFKICGITYPQIPLDFQRNNLTVSYWFNDYRSAALTSRSGRPDKSVCRPDKQDVLLLQTFTLLNAASLPPLGIQQGELVGCYF
jgi:hypothetical protein